MTTSVPDYDVSSAIGSAYVKVADVKAGALAERIKAVSLEHFDARGNLPAREAFVLVFDGEPEHRLVLNKTNLRVLAAAFGPKTSGWLGRDVDLVLDSTGGREFVKVTIPPPPRPRRVQAVEIDHDTEPAEDGSERVPF